MTRVVSGVVLAAIFFALIWFTNATVLLLILAPGSKGEPAAQPGVDNDPEGAPYVAGELLVAYEPGTSEEAEETVVRRSGARTLEYLPGEVRLVSFPAIRRQASEAARERLCREYGVDRRKVVTISRGAALPTRPRLKRSSRPTTTTSSGSSPWAADQGRESRHRRGEAARRQRCRRGADG